MAIEGRGPQGPRGLKSGAGSAAPPARKAGRGPQGPRGLKYEMSHSELHGNLGRGPQGPRGLKFSGQ